ncbi:MAG: branched-chain amino acid ABC transporter permease [Alphaproteobacteria bacterium]
MLIDIAYDALRTAVSTETAIFALLAISLNLQYGYTGLLNFGQVGYLMVGGYAVAITVTIAGGDFWTGTAVAVVMSVVLSLLIGVPTLRLRADYFAITSLAIAETMRLVVRSRWLEPVTGGVDGLTRFADGFYAVNPIAAGVHAFGPWRFTADQLFAFLVAWALAGLAALLVWRLIASPWGRVIRAIREDEDVARSVGKPVFAFKLQSLAIGGVIGALAGVVLAAHQQTVNPEGYTPVVTFYAYTALILGGAGRTLGPVAGSLIFWLILGATDSAVARGTGGLVAGLLTPQQIGTVRFVMVGVALMLLLLYRADGLFARKAAR